MIKTAMVKKQTPLKVTTIGGGSGHFALLSALRDIDNLKIQAVVSMADSGGSTGRLRDELGVLPPGDVLKCLVALSAKRRRYRELLMKRFNDTGSKKLKGHSVGNMLLTFLSEYIDDFPAATLAFGELLETKGMVLPVTTNKIHLVATLADGKKIYGETHIDVAKEVRAPIVKLELKSVDKKQIAAYPPALKAIKQADYVIVGPGDIYTSIIPNLVVPGVKEALMTTQAKLVYVVNLMTKKGETDGFSGDDFIALIKKYIGRVPDVIIANSTEPNKRILKPYKEEGAELVTLPTKASWSKSRLIATDLLSTQGDLARHDMRKLRRTLRRVLEFVH